jgi:hypothetical protein
MRPAKVPHQASRVPTPRLQGELNLKERNDVAHTILSRSQPRPNSIAHDHQSSEQQASQFPVSVQKAQNDSAIINFSKRLYQQVTDTKGNVNEDDGRHVLFPVL